MLINAIQSLWFLLFRTQTIFAGIDSDPDLIITLTDRRYLLLPRRFFDTPYIKAKFFTVISISDFRTLFDHCYRTTDKAALRSTIIASVPFSLLALHL